VYDPDVRFLDVRLRVCDDTFSIRILLHGIILKLLGKLGVMVPSYK
jgi:hypothetical protein